MTNAEYQQVTDAKLRYLQTSAFETSRIMSQDNAMIRYKPVNEC